MATQLDVALLKDTFEGCLYIGIVEFDPGSFQFRLRSKFVIRMALQERFGRSHA